MEKILNAYIQAEISPLELNQWILNKQSLNKEDFKELSSSEFVVYFLSELHSSFKWILNQENIPVSNNHLRAINPIELVKIL